APECGASVHGYYRAEGLDVHLKPGGPVGATFLNSTLAVAANDSIDIGIDNDIVTLLQGRTRSTAPSKNLLAKLFAAFWQVNPMGFLVRADSGLHSLKDLARRKPDGS